MLILSTYRPWQQQVLATWLAGALIALARDMLDSKPDGGPSTPVCRLANAVLSGFAILEAASAQRTCLQMVVHICQLTVHATTRNQQDRSQEQAGVIAPCCNRLFLCADCKKPHNAVLV